ARRNVCHHVRMGPQLLEVAILARENVKDGSRKGYASHKVEAQQYDCLLDCIDLSRISKEGGIRHRDNPRGQSLVMPYNIGDIFDRGIFLVERLDKLIFDYCKTREI